MKTFIKSFSLLSIIIITAAIITLLSLEGIFYHAQERAIQKKVEDDLLAIARLKVNQIASWRKDQLENAMSMQENSLLIGSIARFMESPDASIAQDIRNRFKNLTVRRKLAGILLVDVNGKHLLSFDGSFPRHTGFRSVLKEALKNQKAVLTEIHSDIPGTSPHISVVIPLFHHSRAPRSPFAALVLMHDASQFLYPLIQFWPTPSKTAETLLVQRDGDNVLFLNELRHRSDTALKLRIPLSQLNVPAVMAVLGKKGYFLGKDYRGEEVASVLLPVPDSSWFMVAKVDASEAFSEWRFRSLLMLALFLGLIGCVAGAGVILWQRDKKAHYRALYYAESSLRKSIEMHSVTLKSIGDAVISTNAQGRVELLNSVAETLTGWTQTEAQGKPLEEVFHIINEETREIVESPTVKVLREGIVIGLANHTTLISRDGAERPIADSGAPIRDDRGNIVGVVLVFRDQTSEREAQESLRQSEMRYRQTLDGMREGCQIIGPDWKYIYVNDAATQHGRKKREELIGRTMMDAYPGIEKTSLFALLKQCMQERCSAKKDSEFVFADNSRGFFELGIEPIPEGLFILSLDITERVEAERSLRESEARYRTLFETSADGILIADVATKRFLYANPAMCQFLEYMEEELTAMSVGDLHPQDRLPIILNDFDALAKGDKTFVEDIPCLKKNGEIVYADINVAIFTMDGKLCSAGFFRDITQRKREEAERAKLQAQFIQVQKMESVGRLAGGVAHDYNNILSIIIGNAELAMAIAPPENPVHENLQEIYKAAIHSKEITRQLLTFARKEIIAPEVLDLNAGIEHLLQMLRRLVGEDIDVIWHPGAKLRPVLMDPSQLDQILINLCVNARDAIADTGSIVLETGRKTFDADYCAEHAGFIPGDFVMLSVSDDGCGMDRKTKEYIFEPFFTTKGVGQGTGLGLATVYGIVKQNNGFINVYSEPGMGTTFKIYLPEETRQSESAQKPVVEQVPEGRGELLLVVEDDLAILKITERILKNKNYKVLAAKNPAEALNHVELYADTISLLMTDVVMPGMNGRELAERIMSICPKIQCLFMSGYTANVIAHRGVLDKGLNYIQKPFSMQDLLTKIRVILDQE